MIKALAEVTGYRDSIVTVRCQQQTSCGNCSSRNSCGTGVVSKAFPGKAMDISIPVSVPLAVGSLVEIGLAEKAVLRSALVVYIIPLFFLIGGALLGQFIFSQLAGSGEGAVIVSAMLSGLAGIWLARLLARKMEGKSGYQPTLLRVLGQPVSDTAVINAATEDSE